MNEQDVDEHDGDERVIDDDRYAICATENPWRRDVDGDVAYWLESEHLIHWCADCNVYHLDIDNVGDDHLESSWERLDRLIAKGTQ